MNPSFAYERATATMRPILVTTAALAIGSAGATFADAQEPTDPPRANYAFASQLGSGVYRAENGTVQVYRLGLGFSLRSVEDHRLGLRLRIPVAVGLYDIDLTRALGSSLPDGLFTLTLVPELRMEVRMTPRWRLMPFGALGAGRDFSEGRMSYITAAGLRSRLALDWRGFDALVGHRLFYSSYTTSSLGFGDDFGALESGVQITHGLGLSLGSHRLVGGLFTVNYLYFVSPDLVHFIGEDARVEQQWEVGFTLTTEEPIRVLGIALPTVGLGYRFGSGAALVRIVLGGPFN